MQIVLCTAPSQASRWLEVLIERLTAAGHDVRLRATRAPPRPDVLRRLERLDASLGGSPRAASLVDAVAWPGLQAPAEAPGRALDGQPESTAGRLVIALPAVGAGAQDAAEATHVVTFDGAADAAAVYASLLDHIPPVIAVVDATTGEIVASARPSLEAAGSLREGLDAVYACLLTLIEALAAGGRAGAMRVAPAGMRVAPVAVGVRPLPDRTFLARQAIARMRHRAVRTLYGLSCHIPHWRIGWRLTSGAGVWDRGDLGGAPWQTLPDPGDRFYADPFPYVHEGRRWILFEDFPHRTGKGLISAVEIGECGPVGAVRTVLEEPWHLSYPMIFAHAGQIWMIPETHQNRTIDLYRAEAFPDRWVKEATLVSGIEASDATFVRHQGRLWMFATVRDGWGAWSDTLHLFMADDLLGPWRPHPANPVLIDGATARPAGHFLQRGGTLWRPVQDCASSYGAALGLVEVTRLDPEGYHQELRTRLTAGPDWPGRRLHTLNRFADLECIDGSALAPRNAWLARRTERWTLRRSPSSEPAE